MSFEDFSAAGAADIVNGEHLLLGGTPPGWKGECQVCPAPFYKRRYTWDGDLIMGCTIGCDFCYYRWINNSVDTIGKGRKGLRKIATPRQAVRFLEQSKLFKAERDIIMLAARSDGSMQVNEITEFLRIFPHESPIFVLHRAPFGQKQLEAWGDDPRVVFSTTITPDSPEFRGSPIKSPQQMEGLQMLLDAGISPRRISVMLGPLNNNNVMKGVETIFDLAMMGIRFLTYRGCSIGNFGVAPENDKLREAGFLDGNQNEESSPGGHQYYKMKNWLSEKAEKAVLCASIMYDVRVHRHTGTLYRDEFGMPIAYNRNNRSRSGELGQWKKVNPDEIEKYLVWLGYHPQSIRETEEGYFVDLPPNEVATEDVAMTVGCEFETSVLFNNHRIAPTVDDLKFYAKNHLFWPLPKGWETIKG
ncbi:MAG: hypothetical protein WA091_02730 [Minisyncoccales bacterium]